MSPVASEADSPSGRRIGCGTRGGNTMASVSRTALRQSTFQEQEEAGTTGAQVGYGQKSKTTTTIARLGLALETDRLLVLHPAGHEETHGPVRRERPANPRAGEQGSRRMALARVKVADSSESAGGSAAREPWVVARVCSEYIQYCERGVANGTISKGHRDNTVSFLNDLCKYCGALPVAELKKGHVKTWMESHADVAVIGDPSERCRHRPGGLQPSRGDVRHRQSAQGPEETALQAAAPLVQSGSGDGSCTQPPSSASATSSSPRSTPACGRSASWRA